MIRLTPETQLWPPWDPAVKARIRKAHSGAVVGAGSNMLWTPPLPQDGDSRALHREKPRKGMVRAGRPQIVLKTIHGQMCFVKVFPPAFGELPRPFKVRERWRRHDRPTQWPASAFNNVVTQLYAGAWRTDTWEDRRGTESRYVPLRLADSES